VIRAEYNEFPDLQLTQADVEYLWGLDSSTAAAVLAALTSAGVITRTRCGVYVRANAGGAPIAHDNLTSTDE
jgi:hypothetical protein